jgi:hypothetical protein
VGTAALPSPQRHRRKTKLHSQDTLDLAAGSRQASKVPEVSLLQPSEAHGLLASRIIPLAQQQQQQHPASKSNPLAQQQQQQQQQHSPFQSAVVQLPATVAATEPHDVLPLSGAPALKTGEGAERSNSKCTTATFVLPPPSTSQDQTQSQGDGVRGEGKGGGAGADAGPGGDLKMELLRDDQTGRAVADAASRERTAQVAQVAGRSSKGKREPYTDALGSGAAGAGVAAGVAGTGTEAEQAPAVHGHRAKGHNKSAHHHHYSTAETAGPAALHLPPLVSDPLNPSPSPPSQAHLHSSSKGRVPSSPGQAEGKWKWVCLG